MSISTKGNKPLLLILTPALSSKKFMLCLIMVTASSEVSIFGIRGTNPPRNSASLKSLSRRVRRPGLKMFKCSSHSYIMASSICPFVRGYRNQLLGLEPDADTRA